MYYLTPHFHVLDNFMFFFFRITEWNYISVGDAGGVSIF